MGTQKGLSGIAELFRTYGNYGDPEGLLGNCRIIQDLRELLDLQWLIGNCGTPQGFMGFKVIM